MPLREPGGGGSSKGWCRKAGQLQGGGERSGLSEVAGRAKIKCPPDIGLARSGRTYGGSGPRPGHPAALWSRPMHHPDRLRCAALTALLVGATLCLGGCPPTFHDDDAFMKHPRPLVG